MVEFEQRFPDRYYDVGIAEQHSVTLAAGLACGGMKPVVAIYSTFFQRAYDQLIHDVVLQNLPVVFAIDRAGVVGPDGPTHAGSFDFSFMRCLPNIVVMAPADENECRQMLYTAYQHKGPAAVRYPRGGGPGAEVKAEMTALPLGKAQILRRGKGVALLAFGSMVEDSLKVGEALDLTVINMRFIKPIDDKAIAQAATEHHGIITLEENAVMGGAGSAVCESLNTAGIFKPVLQIGLPDSYLEHGSREELLAAAKLDLASLQSRVEDFISRLPAESATTASSTSA
jgi:1-deoxy-D-xylulose-5-phosphate synthase